LFNELLFTHCINIDLTCGHRYSMLSKNSTFEENWGETHTPMDIWTVESKIGCKRTYDIFSLEVLWEGEWKSITGCRPNTTCNPQFLKGCGVGSIDVCCEQCLIYSLYITVMVTEMAGHHVLSLMRHFDNHEEWRKLLS